MYDHLARPLMKFLWDSLVVFGRDTMEHVGDTMQHMGDTKQHNQRQGRDAAFRQDAANCLNMIDAC